MSDVDVRDLPSFGFGRKSLMWRGTLGLMLIEGTVFALAVVTYFYLRSQADRWPPSAPPPALLWAASTPCCWRRACCRTIWPNVPPSASTAPALDAG